MKDNRFLDEEIIGISSFVKDAKKLLIVEGISCETFETDKQYCNITAICNTSLSYIEKLKQEGKEIDVNAQKSALKSLCGYWNLKLNGNGVIFEVESLSRYLPASMNSSDMEAKRSFACSKIIFDRHGKLLEQQNYLKNACNLEPYTNIIEAENFDKITGQSKK